MKALLLIIALELFYGLHVLERIHNKIKEDKK